MPKDAKLLSTAIQRGEMYLWALVAPEKPLVTRTLHIVLTGWPITDEGWESWTFIGTNLLDNGSLVCHIFAEAGEASHH